LAEYFCEKLIIVGAAPNATRLRKLVRYQTFRGLVEIERTMKKMSLSTNFLSSFSTLPDQGGATLRQSGYAQDSLSYNHCVCTQEGTKDRKE
jgi:hypothetical protein